MPNSLPLIVVAAVILFVAGAVAFRASRASPVETQSSWLVVTAPGPTRGLGRVVSQDAVTTKIEGNGWRVDLARGQLPTATRPLLTTVEAEARVAELSKPSAPQASHRLEQHIRFTKTVSRGTDEEVITMLRQLYARPYALAFGDRKMLDMLEQRIIPELAHVLGRDPTVLTDSVRSHHPVATATAAAPHEEPWPGKGTPDGVPEVKGLDPLGVLDFKNRLLIGQRLDRHAEPDAGIVAVDVQGGIWNAWLEYEAGDEQSIEALVLMRSGAESGWPMQLREVASAQRWDLAPQADLQVIDEESLSQNHVIDAARYLGGTNVYWRRAVTVSTADGWPEQLTVLSSSQMTGPLDVVVIRTRPNAAVE